MRSNPVEVCLELAGGVVPLALRHAVPLVCEPVDRILGGAVRRGGAFAPGELFDADDFLRTLSPQELTFELGSPASATAPAATR